MKDHNLDLSDFDIDEIVSIELIGEGDTIDITVDDTHMFYANDVYSHNSGTQKSIIQNDDIAESFNKVFCSDIILTFSRKLEDKVNDVGNLHLSKNRYGADGRTFDITTNLNIGQISVKSENHSAVQNYIKEMNNNGPTNFQKQIYSKMKSKSENIFR